MWMWWSDSELRTLKPLEEWGNIETIWSPGLIMFRRICGSNDVWLEYTWIQNQYFKLKKSYNQELRIYNWLLWFYLQQINWNMTYTTSLLLILNFVPLWVDLSTHELLQLETRCAWSEWGELSSHSDSTGGYLTNMLYLRPFTN